MIKRTLIKISLVTFISLCTLVCYAQDNDIKLFKLENGHTVIVKEVHTNPIVTIDTWVKTGSINENYQNNGAAHFLEHLFFKGSKNHKQGEFEKILESKGAVFNAATSKDFTHFYITIASNYFDTALDLQSDMLLNPTFPIDELNRERKVVQEEIGRSKDNPDTIMFKNLNNILFSSHPYKKEVIGTEQIIENIKRDEIIDFYRKWYSPSNMVTVVVGDVDTNCVLAKIKSKFNDNLIKNAQAQIKYKRDPDLTKAVTKVEKGQFNTGYMIAGFRGTDVKNKKDAYALDLASVILGDGRSSRLYQDIKEKKRLVSSIGAGNFSLRDDSIFYIEATFKPEDKENLEQAIESELKQLRETLVSQEELCRAKTLLQRNFLYSNESVASIANSIGYNMTIGGSLDYYTDYIDDIKKISAEDIKKTVNKYILDTRMAESVVMPEKNEKPVADVQAKINGVSSYKLNNGISMIVDQNKSNEIIALSVFVKGGKLVEPIPGISSVVATTLMKGTKNRNALKIAEDLENLGIIIAPSANSDYFEIQLKSTRADFNKAFEILADIIENPTFESEYIEKSKQDILQGVKSSRDTPVSVAFEEYGSAMYPNRPYGYVGKVIEKTVPKITRADVLSYYKKYFIPGNMVVSVSGNVDGCDLSTKFSELGINMEGLKVDVTNLVTKFKPLAKNKLVSVKKDISAGWLVIGWPVAGMNDVKDYATLEVINSILGGGMSSRLFSNLREKQGLAYEVSTVYSSRLDNTSFAMYIGTKPKNLELAKKQFLQEINKIMKEPVSEKELIDAKQNIVGRYALSQETNGQKAHNLGWYEVIGKSSKFNSEYPDLINSVSSQDITRVANKYFSEPHVISVVGPDENVKLIEKEYNSESKR